MTKLETENIQQKEEISAMKNTVSEDRIMVSNLTGQVERLKATLHRLVETNNDQDFFGRLKLPVRLLPPHFFFSKISIFSYSAL